MPLNSGRFFIFFKRFMIIALVSLIPAAFLSACSSTDEILETVNPANWFEDDETIPGAEAEYPDLGEVPDRPAEPEVKDIYQELKSGLIADTDQARYTDKQLRSQTIPAASLSLIQAKQLPDPETPAAPADTAFSTPAGETAAVTAPALQTVDAKTAPALAPAQTAPAPAAEPLAPAPAPAAEPLAPAPAPAPVQPPETAIERENIPANSSPPAQSPDMAPGQDNIAAAPAATPATAPVQPAEKKLIAIIYFADGSARLNDLDRSVIAQVGEIYRQGGKMILITGHSSSMVNASDSVQAGLINFKMSLNRAKSVADAFHKMGIPQTQLSIAARGANNPRYQESNDAGIAGNRRAEIYIEY